MEKNLTNLGEVEGNLTVVRSLDTTNQDSQTSRK